MPITKKFAFHSPSEAALVKTSKLREAFSALDAAMLEYGTPSRETSIALTHIETAAMFAIKGVVSNDADSVALTTEE